MFGIVPISEAHGDFVRAEIVRHWVTTTVYAANRPFDAIALPGYVALEGSAPVGHVTLHTEGDWAEIITLSSGSENRGIGLALVNAAIAHATERGCARLSITITNDNLRAMGFLQKRGWRLIAVHHGMIDLYRAHGKEIPRIGLNGIPCIDEIELEMILRAD